eukprot:Em0012g538a
MLSIIIAQACCKGYLVRRRCLVARQALIKVQAIVRGHLSRLQYQKCRAAVVAIQSYARGWLVRHEIAKQVAAAVVIQRRYRSHRLKQQLSVTMTEVSEKCSQVVVSYNTIPVLLNFISSTNRSMASLHVIKVVLKILLNICKNPTHKKLVRFA